MNIKLISTMIQPIEDRKEKCADHLLERKITLLLKTGQLLIESMADSNRIDRNMRRVVLLMNIPADKFHMHLSYTTLMININEEHASITRFQKCRYHAVNLDMLAKLSTLSWVALEQKFTLEQYDAALNEIIEAKKLYPRWMIILAVGLACGSFCKLFGCDWPAFWITSFAASTALFVRQTLHKYHYNGFLNVAISAFCSVLIAGFSTLFDMSTTPQHPIFASVLFLIPGLPIINSVEDMIDGYTIVGFTRALIVSITIGAIAFGMIFALKLLQINDYSTILLSKNSLFMVGLSGAMAAGGFAIFFNVPIRALFFCFLGGILAVVVRNILLIKFGVSLPISSFFGALSVGFMAVYLAHRLKIPANVFAVPAVIPMIPGILLYKTIIGFLSLDASMEQAEIPAFFQAVNSGINGALSVLSIALGIAISSVIGRKYFARSVAERMNKTLEREDTLR